MVIQEITGLGLGIITLGVIIGIGIVLLATFGQQQASCPSGYLYNANSSGTTFTTDKCCLTTTPSCNAIGTNSTNPSLATQNLNSIYGYLGTSNGGLASWIPLIIVLTVGLFFIGAFLIRKGRKA